MSDIYEYEDDDGDDGALEAVIARLRVDRAEREGGLALTIRRARADEEGARAPLPAGWTASPYDLGRSGERLSGPSAAANRTLLYFHGGGFGVGSARSHRGLAAQLGHAAQSTAFTLDYRLAPEHPFPAALEDALEAYRRLLKEGRAPETIVLIGDSAGGALAISTALLARERGLPMPLGIVAIAPWVDLTLSGDSMRFRAEQDPVLYEAGLRTMAGAYLGGADPKTPLASPLFADLAGLPPLLLHVGNDEVLLSDSERFVNAARAVGVDATVEIWPGLFHVWHAHYAELEAAREGISEIGAWLMRRWK